MKNEENEENEEKNEKKFRDGTSEGSTKAKPGRRDQSAWKVNQLQESDGFEKCV